MLDERWVEKTAATKDKSKEMEKDCLMDVKRGTLMAVKREYS